MNLYTTIEIPPSPIHLDYSKNILFIGSCFAEAISKRFAFRKFHTLANPFGVLYNPLSIERLMENAASGKIYTEEDVFFDGELWHCWDAHSSFSRKNKKECLENLNAALDTFRKHLPKIDIAFITLGSAFVYFLKGTDKNYPANTVVSNCHKASAETFVRKRISVEQAILSLKNIAAILRSQNPKIQIVCTVSPLRHFKDGAPENSVSKATLLLAVHEFVRNHSDFAEYFPAYEIVMDELRDYRFYARDMIHLSEVAEDYIFERFMDSHTDAAFSQNLLRVEKFLKAASHRIINSESPKIQEFAQKHLTIAKELVDSIPGLNLELEMEFFKKLLR